MKIPYKAKPKQGQGKSGTVYVELDRGQKAMLVKNLQDGLYGLLELSNCDPLAREALLTRDKVFGPHPSAGKGIHNTLGSLVSGVLKKANNQPNSDLCSVKMLEGVEFATRIFEHFKVGTQYSFTEVQNLPGNSKSKTIIENLFEEK